MKSLALSILSSSIVLAALGVSPSVSSAAEELLTDTIAPDPGTPDSRFDFLAARDVNEPQFLLDPAGRLVLLWREKAPAGSNLFAAFLADDGRFSTPVRVNDDADSVGSYPLDELRAAAAVGPAHRIAVAWGDARGQVRLAESADGGATFAPSRRLEQTETPAYRSFPALTYDAAGTLHAVWIDARLAPDFAEEPADLYYARVSPDAILEHNLTAGQEPSVCGCCRPYIESGGPDHVRVAFRNTTAEGYRDIFTVTGSLEEGFSAPEPVSEPLWKLQGCPTSGPILAAGEVLWPDGSSGRKILRRVLPGEKLSAPFFEPSTEGDWSLRLPPRPVSVADAEALLLPGRDRSRLVVRDSAARTWRLAADDLPAWATSAWLDGDRLWLIGALNGEFFHDQRPFPR